MQTTSLVGIKANNNIATSITAIGAYVAPAGGITISWLTLANTTAIGTAAVTVDCSVFDGSQDYYLAKNYILAPGDTLNVIGESGGRLVLSSGYSIRVRSSVAASVDAVMAVVSYT